MPTMMIRFSPLVAVVAIILSSHSGHATNHGEILVQWLRSKENGFFSDKLVIRSTKDGVNGVFATADIAKNETIVIIPESALLRASSGPYTADDSEDMCDTALNLVREYYKGEASTFAPYIDYVMGHMRSPVTRDDPNRYRLPAAWSRPALEIMDVIIGDEVEPQALADVNFLRTCRHNLAKNPLVKAVEPFVKVSSREDQKELLLVVEEAWRIVVARSWNEVMVPVYDMINHRNGHWHNADQLTSVHETGSLIVGAVRDIKKGEQLYISYNECHDYDCEGLKYKYVVQQIFKDYGFVEQHPRRWRFDFNEDLADPVVFEVDLIDPTKDGDYDEKDLMLTWLSDPPTLEQFHFFHGHLQKQRELKPYVEGSIAKLASQSERQTIREFYDALTTAFEMAVKYADVTPKATHFPDDGDDGSTGAVMFDDLNVHGKKPGAPISGLDRDEASLPICSGDTATYMGDAAYEKIGDVTSQYQNIMFEHNPEIDDTCLYLSHWLQTCTSWRAHYHESVVHYPARFVDSLKRVIYLGGGDNMLLHEILKYPTLEVVMGMELDQEVVRSSFKHLGTQPHFDNPKVQWWFGDATKSLNMLLEQGDEFYGTFDLVIVDLQTNVAETLMVTRDKTIMDVAMQLLQPEGILARNEDFYPRRSVGFAKYEVDLEFLDVPMLCQQSITIGSTSVDFLTKEPVGHDAVETIYLNHSSLDDGTDKFARWLNYRNNDVPDPDPTCAQADAEEERGYGVHMILEVENTKVAKEKPEKVYKLVRDTMANIGFTELAINESPKDHNVEVIVYVEGFVVVQVMEEPNYIALDIKLFTNFGKLEPAREKLVSVLSHDPDKPSASSLRVVTGGMFGVPGVQGLKQAPTCGEKGTLDAATVESINDAAIATIVEKAAAMGKTQATIAVLCSSSESSCVSLKALRDAGLKHLIPVMACPDLQDGNLQQMKACSKETSSNFLKSVVSTGKIDIIVVDTNAPKAMGQILHKLLRDKQLRLELLPEEYAVVTLSLDPSLSSWQQALLERFHTEFDLHSPAQRSLVLFESQTNRLEVGIFSTGGVKVFHSVGGFLDNVEKEIKLIGHLRRVDNGALRYKADFSPNVIGSTGDFDRVDATKQWLSQIAVGHQTILQFEIETTLSHLEAGARVLVNYEEDVWKGRWSLGRVVEEMDAKMYSVVMDGEEEEVMVSRGALRRFENDSALDVRQPVLIRRAGGFWSQGAVIERLSQEGLFRVRGYDSDGDVMTVHRKHLVARFETNNGEDTPKLSSSSVYEVVATALSSAGVAGDDDDEDKASLQLSGGMAEGCIITGFWLGGHAVASWDGRAHIDLSVYTADEDDGMRDMIARTIMNERPFLKMTARDEMPRGLGRVVNFRGDTENDPHWLQKSTVTSKK